MRYLQKRTLSQKESWDSFYCLLCVSDDDSSEYESDSDEDDDDEEDVSWY